MGVRINGSSVGSGTIHQLKITLRDVRPPIWRRLQVQSASSLGHLSSVVQAAMGWDGSHPHLFFIGGDLYADDEIEDPGDGRKTHEDDVTLDKVAPPKTRLRYEYDFGDGWQHDIVVEKVLLPEPGIIYPRCLTGRRACPPEDCGGPWGYARLLAAVADPHGTADRWLLQFAGEGFDPEAFDPASVNARYVPFPPRVRRHRVVPDARADAGRVRDTSA